MSVRHPTLLAITKVPATTPTRHLNDAKQLLSTRTAGEDPSRKVSREIGNGRIFAMSKIKKQVGERADQPSPWITMPSRTAIRVSSENWIARSRPTRATFA
jgi:hypothetical protein